MARRMISDMAYPAFLVHAAIFIIPTLYFLFLGGSVVNYLLQTFGALLPIYAVVFLLLFACQGKHGESWRAIIERTLHPIPVLGNARRNLALARLAAALEALLSAGVPILDAWELAAAASGSPALRRVVSSWHPRLMSGATPGELLRNSPDFPELFANFYNTGEVSGTIDENLRRLHKYYLEEGSRKLRAVVEWTPRLVYLVVALLMAWQIISMWIGYVSQIRDVLGF
jgi:type II secretory pathway component PulF